MNKSDCPERKDFIEFKAESQILRKMMESPQVRHIKLNYCLSSEFIRLNGQKLCIMQTAPQRSNNGARLQISPIRPNLKDVQ